MSESTPEVTSSASEEQQAEGNVGEAVAEPGTDGGAEQDGGDAPGADAGTEQAQ